MRYFTNLIVVTFIMLLTGCWLGCCRDKMTGNGARLDITLTGAGSPQEIEFMIRKNLSRLYSGTEIDGRYTIYRSSDGQSEWEFVQVADAPRGLNKFSVFCYEREMGKHENWVPPTYDHWLLRAYLTVNAGSYTNNLDQTLTVYRTKDHINVEFRGEIIFCAVPKGVLVGPEVR